MCLPFSRRLWWFYYPLQSCQHTRQNPWTLASMISHFLNLVLTRHSLTCFPESWSWSSSAPSSNQEIMMMKNPPRWVILDNFADKFSGLSRPAGNTETIRTSHWHCLQDYHDNGYHGGGDTDHGGGDGNEKQVHKAWKTGYSKLKVWVVHQMGMMMRFEHRHMHELSGHQQKQIWIKLRSMIINPDDGDRIGGGNQ